MHLPTTVLVTPQSFQDLGASNLLGHTLEDPAHVHVTESREGPQQCGVGRPSVAAEIAIGPRGSTVSLPWQEALIDLSN